MADVKKELVQMLNQALEMEHAARIQYLAHAELVSGMCSEAIIARLKELADDEKEHEDMFREMIGGYLGGAPSMGLAETKDARASKEILSVNLQDEKDAVDFYKKIYRKIIDSQADLPYAFETLEHKLRHIIIDEQEHISELGQLLDE